MKKRTGSILTAVILAVGIFSTATVQRANSQSATPTWDQYCMGCHGSAASFGPRTVAQIQAAINANRGGMGSLKNLTAAQLQAISNELSGNTADTTPPTVTAFTIPSTSTSLTVSITTFTATDNVAVTGYLITESATKPSATATGWTAARPTSYTASAAGARTLYAWAKDAANNVSTGRSAPVTITLPDTTPPTVTAFTIPSTSTSLTVSITGFTATDNVAVTGYLITESAAAPSATAAGWSATRPTSYAASAAGARTLYAWAKDAANNVSTSRSASVTITLPPTSDTTPPSVTAFTIPSTSTSLTISITTFTATDNVGVTGYVVTESGAAPSATGAGWSATRPTSYTASAAGARTLYAWAKDAANNVSTSRSASVTITLPGGGPDATPPTITAFSLPATSESPTVPINLMATDDVGVTAYLVKTNPRKPLKGSPLWRSTPPTSHAFRTSGTKTLYAWAKDAAGNISATSSATVNISRPESRRPPRGEEDLSSATKSATSATGTTSAPAASAALPSTTSRKAGSTAADRTAPSIASFKVPANSASLTVAISSFSAADNLRVAGYMVNESPAKPSPDDPNWRPSAPTSYRFTTAGTKTLYAWVKDAAGNVSASRSAVVRISLPTSTPSHAPALPRNNLKR